MRIWTQNLTPLRPRACAVLSPPLRRLVLLEGRHAPAPPTRGRPLRQGAWGEVRPADGAHLSLWAQCPATAERGGGEMLGDTYQNPYALHPPLAVSRGARHGHWMSYTYRRTSSSHCGGNADPIGGGESPRLKNPTPIEATNPIATHTRQILTVRE